MKLAQLKIRNFRCYRQEIIINFNDLTAIIGKNDAGKSTILEALEIFFNDQIVSMDKDDLNKHSLAADDCVIEISCVFDEIGGDIIIDANMPTSLASEYLLNSEGLLEIKKTFKGDAKTPKPQVFIVCNYPTANQFQDLHQLKIAQLRTRANEVGAPATGYNGNVSSSIRKAIWARSADLQLASVAIPIDKEDAKKIWEVLEKWMPMFALFQSDRKSRDDDKEVTDPMKVAINEALQGVTVELQAIQEVVRERAVEVANRTLAKLQEMSPELATELIPDFKADPKWNAMFSLSLSSDMNIPVNKRGSGVRRLILLNFFRAEAEKRKLQVHNPNVIYAFEEPETSQHPDHQRMLIKAFIELSESADTQVIITTHTPALAGLIKKEQLRLISKNNAGQIEIEKGNDNAYERIAGTLGVLPDPGNKVQLLIGVEGPNDVSFLRRINVIARISDPTLIDLMTDERLLIFPLGGTLLKKWVTVNYLKKLNKPEFHIYDRDDVHNPPYQQAVNDIIARGAPNHAVLTVKRTLENYIHPNAIQRIMGIQIPMPADFDDVPLIVAEAVHNAAPGAGPWGGLSDKARSDKVSRAKNKLNDAVVQNMTVAELNAMDPAGEIVGWFQAIAAILQ